MFGMRRWSVRGDRVCSLASVVAERYRRRGHFRGGFALDGAAGASADRWISKLVM